MRISVRTLSGNHINFKHSFYRHSVDLIFAILTFITFSYAITHLPLENYIAAPNWFEKSVLISQYEPFPFNHLTMLWYIWTFSEVIVLLFNEKKRALHDYIAGTVVIRDGRINFI